MTPFAFFPGHLQRVFLNRSRRASQNPPKQMQHIPSLPNLTDLYCFAKEAHVKILSESLASPSNSLRHVVMIARVRMRNKRG